MIFNYGKSLVRLPLDKDVPEFTLPVKHTDNTNKIEFDVVRGYIYWLHPEKRIIMRSLPDGKQFKIIKLQHENISEHMQVLPHDFSLEPYSNTVYWTDERHNTINFYHLNTSLNGTVVQQSEKTKMYYPRKIAVFPMLGRMYWSSVQATHLGTSILSSNFAGTDIKNIKTFDWAMDILDLKIDFVDERIYWLEATHKTIFSISIHGLNPREYHSNHMHSPVSIGISGKYLYWAENPKGKKSKKIIYKSWKNNYTDDGVEFHALDYELKNLKTVNMTQSNGMLLLLASEKSKVGFFSLDQQI